MRSLFDFLRKRLSKNENAPRSSFAREDRAYFADAVSEIDKMSSEVFYDYIIDSLKSRGYVIVISDPDLSFVVVEKGLSPTLVLLRKFKANISESSILEALSLKSTYSCNEAWVITNSYFSQNARTTARTNHVVLIDRDALNMLIVSS